MLVNVLVDVLEDVVPTERLWDKFWFWWLEGCDAVVAAVLLGGLLK